MATKQRLSVSVDSHLIEEARTAVAEGHSPSLSSWVSEALVRHTAHERRLRALDEFFAAYEAEHGAFTAEEMEAAHREAKERAIVIRGSVPGQPGRGR